VLVVPRLQTVTERYAFGELEPGEPLLRQIAEHLDARRTIGARLIVEPPHYHWLMVRAKLRVLAGADPEAVQAAARAALFRHFHPTEGAADGRGWPFGRPVVVGDAFSVLAVVPGVEIVEDAQLFAVDPHDFRPSGAERIEIAPNALPYSYDHIVRVADA
jgi:predicted phage baseplate assembly protein